jgi:hypothetical protein
MGYGFQSDSSDFYLAGRVWHRWLVAAALIAAAGLVTPDLSAQVLYGSLVGNVKDSSDAAVPRAVVTAVNNGTNQSRKVVTDDRATASPISVGVSP